jgi:hypothetical protein
MQIIYSRRKQMSECYIDDRSPLPTVVTQNPCPCVRADYEWCAQRRAAGGRCHLD